MSPYTIRDRYAVRYFSAWPNEANGFWGVIRRSEDGNKLESSFRGIGAEQSARLRAEELNERNET
jgi:hypothetical protein